MKFEASRKRGTADSSNELPSFRLRLRSAKAGAPRPKLKSFIGRVKALVREQGRAGAGRRARGGRGGSAAARIPARASPQRVAIKTRIVQHGKFRRRGASSAIQDEISYIRRRGASEDGEVGVAFDSEGTLTADELTSFRDHLVPDRHHFKVMVSPEQAVELDLPQYTREFVKEVEKDLGTKLEWFGVAHYDTDNPHVHLMIRGKDSKDQDLVISRDYISHGMRLQAGEVATKRLGPRRSEDIERSLNAELTVPRVTTLDRMIDSQRLAHPDGLVTALKGKQCDLARDQERVRLLARLQYLEGVSLAREVKPGIWLPDEAFLKRLKAMSIQGDIIKTLNSRMTGKELRDPLIIDPNKPSREAFIGRVITRARVDEFFDDEYLIADTQSGRTVYLPLSGVAVIGDTKAGAVVQIARNASGGLAVRELPADLPNWSRTVGVTELDRALAANGTEPRWRHAGQGFAREYEQALRARFQFLEESGLTEAQSGVRRVRSNFLDQLYGQELNAAHTRLKPRFGERQDLAEGSIWQGTVRAIEALPSGPHAAIVSGGRYILIPATPALERSLDRGVQLKVSASLTGSSREPRAHRLTIEVTTLRRPLYRGLT